MTRWISVITFEPEVDDAARQRWFATANALDDVIFSQAGPHVSGSVGPGHGTWDLTLATGVPPAIPGATCECAALDVIRAYADVFEGPRIKRTLLLRIREGTPDDIVKEFEASLAAMPDHITAIRSWALSRIRNGRWTHAWEQEFAELDGLRRDYMLHPYHWTGVERWFDPEIPGSIVDPDLAHLIREAPGQVLTDVVYR